jgi:hypothetical protein
MFADAPDGFAGDIQPVYSPKIKSSTGAFLVED